MRGWRSENCERKTGWGKQMSTPHELKTTSGPSRTWPMAVAIGPYSIAAAFMLQFASARFANPNSMIWYGLHGNWGAQPRVSTSASRRLLHRLGGHRCKQGAVPQNDVKPVGGARRSGLVVPAQCTTPVNDQEAAGEGLGRLPAHVRQHQSSRDGGRNRGCIRL